MGWNEQVAGYLTRTVCKTERTRVVGSVVAKFLELRDHPGKLQMPGRGYDKLRKVFRSSRQSEAEFQLDETGGGQGQSGLNDGLGGEDHQRRFRFRDCVVRRAGLHW